MILRKDPKRHATRSAFTLMEVLVVAAIIVVLAGVGLYGFTRYQETAKEKKARADCMHIAGALEDFKDRFTVYPDNLLVLTEPIDNAPAYLDAKVLVDPWGQPYQLDVQNLHPTLLKAKVFTYRPGSQVEISNW
jgi:general secretion pathway protein G